MKALLDRSVMLLLGILSVCTVTTGLLAPQHFSYSFLLNRTEPEPCGINIGGDELNIDPTSAIPGTNSYPISPSFYFFGGRRCRASTPDHSAYFVISQGFQDEALALSSELSSIAERMAKAAGKENVVTFGGARLNEKVRGVSHLAVRRTKRGGRFERIRGALETGSVLCGPHSVIGALFVRVKQRTEFSYAGSEVFTMRPGMMYAVVGTEERVCMFGGHTRAPEEALGEDVVFFDPIENQEISGSESSSRILGASIGGGLAIGLVVSSIGLLFYVKWRKKSQHGDESLDENSPASAGPTDDENA